jgi:hypothetical protein
VPITEVRWLREWCDQDQRIVATRSVSRASRRKEEMKAGKMPKQDVQFIARDISFDIYRDKVVSSTYNFEMLEVGAAHPEPELQTGSVQFHGGISKEDALVSLRVISKAIEEDGLPTTSWTIPRDYAQACLSVQASAQEMFAILEKLPNDVQRAFQPVLENVTAPDFKGKPPPRAAFLNRFISPSLM